MTALRRTEELWLTEAGVLSTVAPPLPALMSSSKLRSTFSHTAEARQHGLKPHLEGTGVFCTPESWEGPVQPCPACAFWARGAWV